MTTRSQFIKTAIVILVLMIIFIPLTQYLVRFMTYPAPPITVPSPPQPFREVAIEYTRGESAIGWLYENSAAQNAPVILMFHGNGENLETMRRGGMLHQFMDLNVSFLALDYPGYGRSDGKPSEQNNIAAANAAFQWIVRNFETNPRIIFGWSLGAAVAIPTAAQHQSGVDGLIAVSPWSSLPEVAAVHYPGFLVKPLLKESYNSVEAARQIDCPTLIIHGEQDNIIPISQGKKVAEVMGAAARWVPVPHTGHNDIFGRELVWEVIGDFISACSK